jgi:hypothetical protein
MLGGHASGPAAVDRPGWTRDNRRSSARTGIASAPIARLSRDPCSRNSSRRISGFHYFNSINGLDAISSLQSSQNLRLGRAWEEMTVPSPSRCPEHPRCTLYGHAKGGAGLLAAPALSERRHCGLARRLVALRRRAILMERPKSRATERLRARRRLHDAADHDTDGEHIVAAPFAGRALAMLRWP